jgi:hypothetical protein
MINVFHEETIDSHLLSFVLNSPIYKKSDIENCDFIVHEKVLREKKTIKPTLKSLSKKYKHINRFIIVFIINDEEKTYQRYDNVIVVRTSLKASKRKDKELVMPFIWDLDKAYPPLNIENNIPRVGFCGLNSKYRKKLIKVFSASPAVRSDFILRKKFWGGSPHDAQIIKEFNDNMKENVFIISQRGAGNYSMRFYQALAAGRIPVLVNTNMTLPFENKINWNDLIVFEKDEVTCLKKVIDVFKSGKYIQMQNDCAKLFSSYFSDTTFFSHLVDQILTYDDVLMKHNKRRDTPRYPKSLNSVYRAVFRCIGV